MSEFFEKLAKHEINYAVLRNYDNILEEEPYMDGHGDIDLMCFNPLVLANVTEAEPHEGHIKNGMPDGIHYYIYLNGNKVSLDLRSPGDGYYCESWSNDMLRRRVFRQGYYVLSDEDHFFSLIYHAVFQKADFSQDYRNRLQLMSVGLDLDVKNGSVKEFVQQLEMYMGKNGYRYQYPKDRMVPLERKYIQNTSLFDFNLKDWWQHYLFQFKVNLIEKMVRIKHGLKKP